MQESNEKGFGSRGVHRIMTALCGNNDHKKEKDTEVQRWVKRKGESEKVKAQDSGKVEIKLQV